MSVTAKKLAQATLNVSGSVVTLVTGVASGHTEISSIWFANTGVTARVVTLLAHGTGITAAYELITFTLQPRGNEGSTYLFQMNGAPLILIAADTLRAYQDAGTDVNAVCYGIEEV